MKLGEEVEGQEKAPVIVEPAPSKREDQEKPKIPNGDTLKASQEVSATKLQESGGLTGITGPEKLIVPPAAEPAAATVA